MLDQYLNQFNLASAVRKIFILNPFAGWILENPCSNARTSGRKVGKG